MDSKYQPVIDTQERKIAELESTVAMSATLLQRSFNDLIVENSPVPMVIASNEGTFLSYNSDAESVLGRKTVDSIELETRDFFVEPSDLSDILALMKRHHKIRRHQTRFVHKDGTVVWATVNARTIRYDDSDAVMLAIMDISHAPTREAEGQNEKRTLKSVSVDSLEIQTVVPMPEVAGEPFRTIFEGNYAVSLVIDPSSARIVGANDAAASFYGYTVQELLSMSIKDINTLPSSKINETLEMAMGNNFNHNYFRHRLKNGSVRDVEVLSCPIYTQSKVLMCTIINDISSQRNLQKFLAKYKRIVATTPDLVSLVDENYTYCMVNDAYLRTYRMERHSIIGKSVEDLVGKELFETVSKPSIDKAFSGEHIQVSKRLDLPNIGRRYMAVAYTPIPSGNGTTEYISIVARDITELKAKEEKLKQTTRRLDIATSAGNIGIWDWDIITGELTWDKKMVEMYKMNPVEMGGVYEAWKSVVHPHDLPVAERKLNEAISNRKPFNHEYRIIWPSGEVRTIKADGIVLEDAPDGLHMIGVNQDITEQRVMERELRKQATTDYLTKISNRRHFMDQLKKEFDRCTRHMIPLTVMSMDIDHFKTVNDQYGHAAGDEVLKDLANLTKNMLRNSDSFGRIGGEEFAVALYHTDIEAAKTIAERLRQRIEQHSLTLEGETIKFTISIGLSEITPSDQNALMALKRADSALYKAKREGRNKVAAK